MRVLEYDNFVKLSDKTKEKFPKERLEITIFGLAGEIGSVVAAVKKRVLSSGNPDDWNIASDEIVEELGDVVWYCFSLARIANLQKFVNIFIHDINNLRQEIGGNDGRAERIGRLLEPGKRAEFLEAAKVFPTRTRTMHFEDYQNLAILTARTQDKVLLEVCLAVLSQLGAELLRKTLPDIEIELNRAIADRPINDILGEIAWHVSALASTYRLTLSEIAQENIRKNSQRYAIGKATPLHDAPFPKHEQFPRQFDVSVISIGKGRSRLYLDGKRLGDDLTDNSSIDDGYRFHDVMHLANIAKLGWSPVFRGLMGLKRKSDIRVDEIEDGARAKIVEEALIKVIHSEGIRQAKIRTPGFGPDKLRLFLVESEISNNFLGFIRDLVSGLEVESNKTWEWIETIVSGYDLFHKIRKEKQGTVSIDLDQRSIKFRPEVSLSSGRFAGIGNSSILVPPEPANDTTTTSGGIGFLRELIIKQAIANACNMEATPDVFDLFSITEFNDGQVSVKARGRMQEYFWSHSIVSFKVYVTADYNRLNCTAIALADE